MEPNTEQKILEAAEDIFHAKGFDGTRMQEIAATAGINKGLLHYYFKTKDKLFEAIFSAALNRMVHKIMAIFEMDITIEEKINHVVDQYMALLVKNPSLPIFVIHELNKNADHFVNKHINSDTRAVFAGFTAAVKKEIKEGRIKPIDPRQLFMNLLSLIIFPFIGRPLLQAVSATDNTAFKQLLNDRRAHIKEFIKNALQP